MTTDKRTREIAIPSLELESGADAWKTRKIELTGLKLEIEDMAKIGDALKQLTSVDGFIGACVADANSGMMLGAEGGGAAYNLEVAAAGNTEVVRAKRKTMASLKLADKIEDILITLGKQYHLIRPFEKKDGLFVFLVLDKNKSNLAMARHQLTDIEQSMEL